MKNILEEIKLKAKALQKTIVLCEGEDSRVVKAAADATKEGIAKIVLLGNEADIKAKNPDVNLDGVTVIDPLYVELVYPNFVKAMRPPATRPPLSVPLTSISVSQVSVP